MSIAIQCYEACSDVGIDIIVIDIMIDTLTLHGLFISKKFLALLV